MNSELLEAYQSVARAARTAVNAGELFPDDIETWVFAHAGRDYGDEVISRLPGWVDDFELMYAFARRKAEAIEAYLGC